ncbi:MAG TPA: hypothetical protein DD434_13140, partial [Bacteroidales bacterium]|nr:hypothetical protein [Bacteroidales bacterium]
MKDRKELKIHEIAKILSETNIRLNNYGLFAGNFGIALFLLEYSKHFGDKQMRDKGLCLIEDVFVDIERTKLPIASFCNGISGIGYGLNYLNEQHIINTDINDLFDRDIDNYLFEIMKQNLYYNNWDYLHGALGIGLYFTMKTKYNNQLLMNIDHLLCFFEATKKHQTSNGLKWLSVIDHETGEIGYNISLSHGISSIAVIMTKMYERKIFTDRTEELAIGAINYILDQEIDVNKYGSYFPSKSKEESQNIFRSRLGWCYGDLGIGMTLLNAGNVFGRKEWVNKAIDVFLNAAINRRNLKENAINDAGLCHGAVGIGIIFYNLWKRTNMPQFKEATNYWINKTLDMATFQDGLAGYKTYHFNPDTKKPTFIN